MLVNFVVICNNIGETLGVGTSRVAYGDFDL